MRVFSREEEKKIKRNIILLFLGIFLGLIFLFLSFENMDKYKPKENNIYINTITKNEDYVMIKTPILIEIIQLSIVEIDGNKRYYLKFEDGQIRVSENVFNKLKTGNIISLSIIRKYDENNNIIDTYYEYEGIDKTNETK